MDRGLIVKSYIPVLNVLNIRNSLNEIQYSMSRKLIFIILVCAVIGVFIYIYLPGYTRHQELKRKENALIEEIHEYESANAELKEEIDLLQNDVAHLEQVLRDEMGLVKPGEVKYKIIEEPLNEIVEESIAQTEPPAEKNN